jgi:hypothetical protein
MKNYLSIILLFCCFLGCKKNESSPPVTPVPKAVSVSSSQINNITFTELVYGTTVQPVIKVKFSEPLLAASVAGAVSLNENGGSAKTITTELQNHDSVLVIQPTAQLPALTKYNFNITTSLKSASGGNLTTAYGRAFLTQIDSAAKFPVVTDDELLTKVQQQTFKYFWDFGHPVSGLARERSNGDNDVVTSGGSGFGIMTIPVAINRNFITRAEGLARMQKIVGFLKNTAVKVKGAFPHWLNGTTGTIIPFSTNDDGADLVETSYLMAGLLTARQYFNGAGADETNLRNDINVLWNGVEWDWFRQGGQDVLYWHYSEGKQWAMNFPIRGWNECLVTYIMAASSSTHGIPAAVYTNGWATGSSFANGNSYFGYQLPLGPPQGGPLFFSHYSFLGINPNDLQDVYASYTTQTKNHTLINYNYCKTNPGNYFGYSQDCWGLTASDIENGYTASSPTNDVGVIAPTAALSSFPYTPAESMKALKFFYYKLGDKIWKDYGFTDAFALKTPWFASSYLAIDQGPIIVMIENYRTGLIWNLLTSCPEVKTGMKALGFTAPYL